MKKINAKLLSIPPYISTSWKNINTIHMKELDGKKVLVIVLHNGTLIEVPGLDQTLIEHIFETHSKYVEQDTKEPQVDSLKTFEPNKESDVSFSFGLPLPSGGVDAMENMGSFLEHNPELADAPDLPADVLKKISAITNALGMDMDQTNMPKPEPHCNCPHCQLARAMRGETKEQEETSEEEVTEEDLRFREWDIKQTGDKLYIVSNPLDKDENYQVFLGNPVGCTCGQKNCEHIRAVLNS